MIIAIGEDSLVERKLLELVLSQTNAELAIYDNGLDLWRHVMNEPPRLVIVDLLLTSLDGFSFCRLMRGHRSLSESPPILAISSMTTPGTEATILEHGATRFLAKPFTPEGLLRTVRELVPEIEPAQSFAG